MPHALLAASMLELEGNFMRLGLPRLMKRAPGLDHLQSRAKQRLQGNIGCRDNVRATVAAYLRYHVATCEVFADPKVQDLEAVKSQR
ncbi:hypothetical protein GUJ93_ZPchr0008g13611 [Zizania palustris]|uniref:Uncharacterized protein n=1 Tax=Zizania palustris TaxID=103762 RepID=A0A8J5V1X4_ZIZPA|nr:hypothetical protein GUJ93_ZPchr0008g13611 [Zizania palustris]